MQSFQKVTMIYSLTWRNGLTITQKQKNILLSFEFKTTNNCLVLMAKKTLQLVMK